LDWNSMDIVKDYQIIQNELKKYSKELAEKKQIIAINKIDLLDDESKIFLKDYFLQENKKVEDVCFISWITWEWVEELMWKAFNLIKDLKKIEKEKNEEKEILENAKKQDSEWFVQFKPHLEENPRDFRVKNIWKYIDLKNSLLDAWKNNISVFWYSENWDEEERVFLDEKAEAEGEWDEREVWQINWSRIEQIVKMTNFDQMSWIARVYDVLEKMHIQAKLENKWWAKDWDILKFWDWEKCLVFRW